MIRYIVIAVLSLLFALAHAQEADVVLTMNSYGPIQIGMPVAEVRRLLVKLGRKNLPSAGKVEKVGCDRYEASKDLRFLVEDGKVVRIETREKNVVTPSGIRIGSTLDRVRRAFGSRIEEKRQHYSDDERDRTIVLVSGDQRFGIRVDGNQTVAAMYAGTEHSIRYVEGCA